MTSAVSGDVIERRSSPGGQPRRWLHRAPPGGGSLTIDRGTV